MFSPWHEEDQLEVGALVLSDAGQTYPAPPKMETFITKTETLLKVEKEVKISGGICPGLSSESVVESGRELRSLGSCRWHQPGSGARNK